MPSRRRFSTAFAANQASRPTTSATTASWRMTPRARSSCQSLARRGAGRTLTPVLLIRAAAPPSAERHGVHQPALGPQAIEPALELQRRFGTDIALEHLAVIAHLLDDVVGPFVVEMQRLAHAGRDAEHALHLGIVALQHGIDILRGDALLLRLDHGEDGPFDDIEPFIVAMPHR